ncbi:MAG: YraN family protein [Clostridia bacterium]|nr:YraN family protein [Clostridia bacterium]
MKNVNNRELGRQGERIAREYLRDRCGYEIIGSNYYASHKEIDIIALDGEYIVFIEVKCRTKRESKPSHRPGRAVGLKKRANIVEAANRFIAENCGDELFKGRSSRVDVIEITVPPIDERYNDGSGELKLSACNINHIRNAFYSDGALR